MQMYMSKPRLAVVRTSWANRPSPSTQGALFLATDVGSGVLFQATGSVWVPVGQGSLGASAVAVSHTGDTNETALATVTVPAGAMGTSGGLLIYSTWTVTNSANNKSLRIRFGGIGGTAYLQSVVTTVVGIGDMRRIRNRNSASSQVGSMSTSVGLGASSGAILTSAVDTTAAADLVLTAQLASAGETITLENYEVWLLP